MNIKERQLRRLIRKRILLEEISLLIEQASNPSPEEEENKINPGPVLDAIRKIEGIDLKDRVGLATDQVHLTILEAFLKVLQTYTDTLSEAQKSIIYTLVGYFGLKLGLGPSMVLGFVGGYVFEAQIDQFIKDLEIDVTTKALEVNLDNLESAAPFLTQNETFKSLKEAIAEFEDAGEKKVPALKKEDDSIIIDQDKTKDNGFMGEKAAVLKQSLDATSAVDTIFRQIRVKLNGYGSSGDENSDITFAKEVFELYLDKSLSLIDLHHLNKKMEGLIGSNNVNPDEAAIQFAIARKMGGNAGEQVSRVTQGMEKARIGKLIQAKNENNYFTLTETENLKEQCLLYDPKSKSHTIENGEINFGKRFFTVIKRKLQFMEGLEKVDKGLEKAVKKAKNFLGKTKNRDLLAACNKIITEPGLVPYKPSSEKSILDIEDNLEFTKYLFICLLRYYFLDKTKYDIYDYIPTETIPIDEVEENLRLSVEGYNLLVQAQELMNDYRDKYLDKSVVKITKIGFWNPDTQSLFLEIFKDARLTIPELKESEEITRLTDPQISWSNIQKVVDPSIIDGLETNTKYDANIAGFNDFIQDIVGVRGNYTKPEAELEPEVEPNDKGVEQEKTDTDQDTTKVEPEKEPPAKERTAKDYAVTRRGGIIVDATGRVGVDSLEDMGFVPELKERLVNILDNAKRKKNFTGFKERVNLNVNLRVKNENNKPKVTNVTILSDRGERPLATMGRGLEGISAKFKEAFRDNFSIEEDVSFDDFVRKLKEPSGTRKGRFFKTKGQIERKGKFYTLTLVIDMSASK